MGGNPGRGLRYYTLGHWVYLAYPGTQAGSRGIRAKKEPGPSVSWSRAITWRRPTLTGPIVPLPSALRRFTSGFGMGPGGSTALWSPEFNPVLRGCRSGELSLVSLLVSSVQFSGSFLITDHSALATYSWPLSGIHMEIY